MENILGEIKLWSGENIPEGFLLCDGSRLNINDYRGLYLTIKNKFGGEDDYFQLPKLIFNEHIKYIICYEGIFYD